MTCRENGELEIVLKIVLSLSLSLSLSFAAMDSERTSHQLRRNLGSVWNFWRFPPSTSSFIQDKSYSTAHVTQWVGKPDRNLKYDVTVDILVLPLRWGSCASLQLLLTLPLPCSSVQIKQKNYKTWTLFSNNVNTTIRQYSSRAFIWVFTPLGFVGQFRI